jgi:sigma-B regulation protein RsbQ
MIDILNRNNVKVMGDKRPTMLFANGFGCDQNVWRYLIPAFKDDYRLIFFDYVGAGQSDLSAYNSARYSSLDGYALDILEIMETLQLRDTIYVGHSVSSMIGVRAAIKKPEYFSKLVFVAPSPCYINDTGYVGGMERADLDGLFTMMDSNYLGWSGMLAPLVMGNSDRPELGDELNANFCATDPDIAREFARVTFLSDNRCDLQNLRVPSLTLQCSQDILAPLEVGQYIKDNTPLNTLKVLTATGHCPHLSAPDETISAIKHYINVD